MENTSKKQRLQSIIGGIIFVLGLILAVCTADGSENEIAIRFAGVALVGVGAIIGGFFAPFKKEGGVQ